MISLNEAQRDEVNKMKPYIKGLVQSMGPVTFNAIMNELHVQYSAKCEDYLAMIAVNHLMVGGDISFYDPTLDDNGNYEITFN